ncbi:hypothetical protein LR48_Vigan07g247200 [Vigna angularis]|uniref:Uncharacterized protein n=1 Tax=Phaseolus angularis TaxID=3914 RepID=A0A0L9V151_PHAAN|nr:hypothetical protein LR48_Vigan07g247200 [Vigna angularis]
MVVEPSTVRRRQSAAKPSTAVSLRRRRTFNDGEPSTTANLRRWRTFTSGNLDGSLQQRQPSIAASTLVDIGREEGGHRKLEEGGHRKFEEGGHRKLEEGDHRKLLNWFNI